MNRDIDNIRGALQSDTPIRERRRAAEQLKEAGWSSRHTLAKRGRLSMPADSPLAEDQLLALNSAITDPDALVRLEVIRSAADLGDSSTVDVLREALNDEDVEMRLAAVNALGEIGGPLSVEVLAQILEKDGEDDDVRLAALTQIEELATKYMTSGPDRRFIPPDEDGVPAEEEPGVAGEVKEQLSEILGRIATSTDYPDLLRLKAGDVLRYLSSPTAS